MGLLDNILGARIEKLAETKAQELLKQKVAESDPSRRQVEGQEDYLFRRIRGQQYQYEIPDGIQQTIVRDSNWLFQTHGIARRIIKRVRSIIAEGGFQYSISFEEGVPDNHRAQIQHAIDRFWTRRSNRIQRRLVDFVEALLVEGEAGFVFDVLSNGEVRLGDLCRGQVAELVFDDFDTTALKAVRINSGKEIEELTLLKDDALQQRFTGKALYARFEAGRLNKRGVPLLQAVIDELTSEKKFRILSTDRTVARMSLFMDTTLTDASPDEVKAYAEEHGNDIPMHGWRFIHNEKVRNEFISANTEVGEITTFIKTMITLIAGALGMPESWFGFGGETTRATAQTQQEPAALDSKSQKTEIMEQLSDLLHFVVDEAIAARYIDTASASPMVNVKLPDGTEKEKPLREAFTVSVTPLPLSKQEDGQPLAATTAALDVISKDDLRASESGRKKLFTADHEISLMNWAAKRDGTDLEFAGYSDEKVRPPQLEAPKPDETIAP
ncbi:MAG TPA: hypothetical protein PK916_04765 [Bacteroidota bacterium]|nr:hypothetical protein [Bacteroidota bacterium]